MPIRTFRPASLGKRVIKARGTALCCLEGATTKGSPSSLNHPFAERSWPKSPDRHQIEDSACSQNGAKALFSRHLGYCLFTDNLLKCEEESRCRGRLLNCSL